VADLQNRIIAGGRSAIIREAAERHGATRVCVFGSLLAVITTGTAATSIY